LVKVVDLVTPPISRIFWRATPQTIRAGSRPQKILEMGGVTEVNTFTKIYLCFFGQYDYDAVPAIPPEIVLFPNGFGSTSTRFVLVAGHPGAAVDLLRQEAVQEDSRELGVESCSSAGRDKSRMHLRWDKKLFSWRNFFLSLDRLTHWFERVHIRPLRSIALRVAEK